MAGSKQMGVYVIVNTSNGKVYVGSTNNLATRRARHWRDLRYNQHRNSHMQRAFNADGPTMMEFRILEVVSDQTALAPREQHWINTLSACDRSTGYNLIHEAEHRTHAPETRARMSTSHKGKPFTPEHRERIGASQRGRPGKPHSAETRAKLSALMMGRPVSAETRAKLSAARKGRPGQPNSPQARAKISAANAGKPKSAEHRQRISAAHMGKQLPPEQRERLAALQRNRSPETRAKLSEANSKLTRDQIVGVRRRAADGERVTALAREFGVSHSSVSEIISRKTWHHIP